MASPHNEIIDSVQLGIAVSVLPAAEKALRREPVKQDFFTAEEVYFPTDGCNALLAHPYTDFRFTTHAPVAFHYFRQLFQVKPDAFTASLCSCPLVPITNPGRSGSLLYLSHDDEFILKSVQNGECKFLQRILPHYYKNLQKHPRTLLPKYFGMYSYISKTLRSVGARLIVINNLLPTGIPIHDKYDLKGSTYNRKASSQEREKSNGATFKDLDFMEIYPEGLILEDKTHTKLLKTLERDVKFLEELQVMDYSLLLGVHYPNRVEGDGEHLEDGEERRRKNRRRKLIAYSSALESIDLDDMDDAVTLEADMESENEGEEPFNIYGGIPAKTARGEEVLLFLGFIDILQWYCFRKKAEHAYKAVFHNGDEISVHRPGFYADRFLAFMSEKVFRKNSISYKYNNQGNRTTSTETSATCGCLNTCILFAKACTVCT